MATRSQDRCSDPEVGALLPAYELGLLDQGARARFEAHTLDCDACFSDLYDFHPYAQEMRTAPDLVHPGPAPTAARARRRETWVWHHLPTLAYAFSLLCLIAFPWVIYEGVKREKELHRREETYTKQLSELGREVERLKAQAAGGERPGEKDEQIAELRRRLDALVEEKRTLERYHRPGPDAVLPVLLAVSREAQGAQTVTVPKDTLFLYLKTRVSKEQDYSRFRLVVKTVSGRTVSHETSARREADGLLTHLVARDVLKPGRYTLEVYGVEGKRNNLLSEVPFRVVAGP